MGKIACATAMGLGTAVGGWKIIKTVGGNIMKIRPANCSSGFVCIDNFRSIITTFPIINNTRCVFINSGVGASNRAKGVKWSTAQRMVVTCYYITDFSNLSWNYILYHSSILKIKIQKYMLSHIQR